ncbi:MAG: RNA methyltransferase [Alphaproteobacteria bacterium]|nr:RNA methyltransferase [Alphaproteobacteria bacterium]
MLPAPVILLVEPQLVENIGMTARAMMNTGLEELRLVNPRDPWPLGEVHQKRMAAASSGADEILQKARVFGSLEEALADLNFVYATSARTHDMTHRIMTPRAATPDMIQRTQNGEKIGVMFGRERTGLINDYVVLANALITIPLNPAFTSLNLAQSVLLIGYEWYQAQDKTPDNVLHTGGNLPATREEYLNFFHRLTDALDDAGFFSTEAMRPAMMRNLHNTLQRAAMTEQEIRTWHGVLSALIDTRNHKKSNDKA